jgi:hypothetical protein
MLMYMEWDSIWLDYTERQPTHVSDRLVALEVTSLPNLETGLVCDQEVSWGDVPMRQAMGNVLCCWAAWSLG